MRTLALLAALLLLAVQAHSATLPEPAEEAPSQDQPEEADQDMAIAFSGARGSAPQDAGLARSPNICRCTRGPCDPGEDAVGSCEMGSRKFNFCCRAE